MKRVLLLLTFSMSLLFGMKYTDRLNWELDTMNVNQKKILMHNLNTTIKKTGDKELALIMTSIAWKESGFGLNRNEAKQCNNCSYGTHQVLLLNAINKLGLKNTAENRKAIRYQLLTDEDLSFKLAMMELKGWLKIHKGNRQKAVASYNAGHKSINSEAGNRYQRDVFLRIKYLERYLEKNKISF